MLLLFLFNATTYLLIRAVQAQYGGGRGRPLARLRPGLGFGFLALTHALTIWIFVAALIFCIFFFRPRGWAAVIILGTFVIIYYALAGAELRRLREPRRCRHLLGARRH